MIGLIAALAATTAGVATAQEQTVHIGRGAHAVYGSLIAAGPPRAGAAVLMLSGSGSEDRNGDDLKYGEKSQQMRLLALGLADAGISSLRFDKGGVGQSAPAGAAASVDALVDEAVAWTRFLQRRPGVRCVVILGHSEGALLATLAARRVKVCGLVLVSGTSRNLGDLIEAQNALAGRSAQTAARVHEIIGELRAGRPVADAPPEMKSVFGPDAQAYTLSEINLDPVAELARVKAPVLVIQGDNDLQVNVDDARRLAAAKGVQPVIVAGMNHVLKLAPKTMIGNFMTYRNPDLPLAPGVLDAVVGFVRGRP